MEMEASARQCSGCRSLGAPTLAGIAIAAALGLASHGYADGDVVLVLPLSRVLGLIDRVQSAAVTALPPPSSPWRGPAAGAPPPPPAFIPTRIHIPDLYRLDFERDAPGFAEPVDNDKMVAFEVVAPARLRPSVSFRSDKESLPLGDSSSRLSVELELPF